MSKPDSPGMVAWFSFVGVCAVVAFAVLAYLRYACAKRQREREREQHISRIEANVKLFSEHQDKRRKRRLLRSMSGQVMELRTEKGEGLDEEAGSTSSDGGPGCSICLETFNSGDEVMRSVHPEVCTHLFHKACIVNWLVSQQTKSLCPECRQPFAQLDDELENPYKNVGYQQELLSNLGPDDV